MSEEHEQLRGTGINSFAFGGDMPKTVNSDQSSGDQSAILATT